MKIFVSHSSRQKLLVHEIERRLPSALKLWIDEKEILVGDNLDVRIETGILDECDLFLLILDDHASKSRWVRKEIGLVIAKEKGLAEPLLLPIVVDIGALDELSEFGLRNRKYISIQNFSGASLDALCVQITNELLAKLARQRSAASKQIVEGLFSKINTANRALAETSAYVRDAIYSHRRTNPISFDNLRQILNKSCGLGLRDNFELKNLLDQLQAGGFLKGYYHNNREAYLSTERVSTKSDLNKDAKVLIGQRAALEISSGMKIGIDTGSTTLELVRELGNLLRSKAIFDLSVVTNSISTAHYLLEVLNSMDAGDADAICRVTLLGGWCRPVSGATVPHSPASLAALISASIIPDELDISFLGANGMYGEIGFGNTHNFEISTKKYFSEISRQVVYLLESRKLLIPQSTLIEEFHSRMVLVTDSIGNIEAVRRVVSRFESAGGRLRVAMADGEDYPSSSGAAAV